MNNNNNNNNNNSKLAAGFAWRRRAVPPHGGWLSNLAIALAVALAALLLGSADEAHAARTLSALAAATPPPW